MMTPQRNQHLAFSHVLFAKLILPQVRAYPFMLVLFSPPAQSLARSKEYWQVVSAGVEETAASTALIDAQKAELEGLRLKDLKA
ncbi:Retrovirus-related Pol polyprotein from transposon TNT 1-94 [Quillaja saponaria]|uniref:Retrovirus-related Pol polyprotein from transposon TNT 1-94 n=1 Tax=Quillaja saponaria TaxID=32244 RepID=A0AAD7P5K1_QUISA|nr:Retrovirus-related Pol polyprotein from transposon TNT 1-94 [Quillaja saponaria]